MTQDLSKVVPKLLAQGLKVLRANAITPRTVNRKYEAEAGKKGSTIDVPVMTAGTAHDVVPTMGTPQASTDLNPTTIPITLNNWKESSFELNDKEQKEVMEGHIPDQAAAHVKVLCDAVDLDVLTKAYQSTWQYVGSATGYTAFDPTANSGTGTTVSATDLRKVLNKGLAPFDDRHAVVTADVEANALQLRAFQDASWSGDIEAIVRGRLNQKLGFSWWMDQNIPQHTAGTLTGATGTGTLGSTSVAVSTGTAAVLNPGDLIKFANHAQIYVVRTAINLGASAGPTAMTIAPALVAAVTAQAISHPPTGFANGNQYYNSLAWQRSAIALVSRPFEPIPSGLGSIEASAIDEVTGLALRLEVTRGHKTQRWAWDILWGSAVLRPENVVRLIDDI